MKEAIRNKFTELERLVGNTPLLAIDCEYKGEKRTVYAKYEGLQLSGSIKDRVALYIMRRAYESGAADENSIIAEADSGNTGIAFAAVGAYLGNKVRIFMPDWISAERVDLMKSCGAEITPVSNEQGGFFGAFAMAEQLAKDDPRVFLPGQFSNEDNCTVHFETTGAEIAEQLGKLGLTADAVVAGAGTGGTITGIGRRLRTVNPECRLFPLVPLSCIIFPTGYRHNDYRAVSCRIPGISDVFIHDIMKLDGCGGAVSVEDTDSVIAAQRLSRELGISAGISSGANLLGALEAGDRIGGDKTIVTVFADDNKKYLSADHYSESEVREGEMTRSLKLLGVRTIEM